MHGFLKESCFGLCKPLSMLYNLTLESIHYSPQTGNKHLLHCYSKTGLGMIQTYIVLLVLLHKFLIFCAIKYNRIPCTEWINFSAFVKGRSCLTNLFTALNDWTSAMDNGTGTDIIFLDFQKVFDTVPHCRLI